MILKYTSPEAVPLSFKLGRRRICGIPEEFSPKVSREFVDSNIGKITVHSLILLTLPDWGFHSPSALCISQTT